VRLGRGLRLFEGEAKFCIYTVEFMGYTIETIDQGAFEIAATMKMAIDEVQKPLKREEASDHNQVRKRRSQY